MSKKVKPYYNFKEVVDNAGTKHTVLVYGEVKESDLITGFAPVTFTRNGHVIKETKSPIIVNKEFRSPVREFNMGYAICNVVDTFDVETGIKIAKKRFAKSPLSTQNGSFLNKDMAKAIVDNELNYISENVDRFIEKSKF